MKRRWLLAAVLALSVIALVPASALATEDNDDSNVYSLIMPAPNIGQSGDGDTISMTGFGTFSWHPKSIAASGSFTMTDDGTTISGTWSTNELLSFQPFGCGVLNGNPLPNPNACGGIVKFRAVFTSGTLQMEAIVTVVCVIGDVPGPFFETRNAIEGVAVNVIGVENYSQPVDGMNVFLRTAGTED